MQAENHKFLLKKAAGWCRLQKVVSRIFRINELGSNFDKIFYFNNLLINSYNSIGYGQAWRLEENLAELEFFKELGKAALI